MIHAQENHDSHTSVVNGKMVRIPNFLQKGSNTTTFQLIEAHGRVFKYGIKLGYSFNTIQWSLQYIGPRNEANEYVLLLSFIDKNKVCTCVCLHHIQGEVISGAKMVASFWWKRLNRPSICLKQIFCTILKYRIIMCMDCCSPA